MNTWTDENTGRLVRQLTNLPEGARVPYFRWPRDLPDGRVIAFAAHASGSLIALDPASGELEFITDPGRARILKFREADGWAWYYDREARELWGRQLPNGEVRLRGRLGPEVPGEVADVTCDGRTLIGSVCECEPSETDGLFDGDFRRFWRWIYRKRSAVIWSYDVDEARYTEVVRMPEYNPQHLDTSPVDPGLFKYAQDGLAAFDQRIHTVRVDGSEWRMVRPQVAGEWVHHEFWWPGGQLIGYKYMDRRGDATIHQLPWGEYAPRPLQLGVANLAGEEVYLSDPLEHYHSHLDVSSNARFATGEGTYDYGFACAAPFDMADTRIAFQALATIHTPYKPAAAQGVETGVSMDNRWVIFNDTVDGQMQVCAVELDL